MKKSEKILILQREAPGERGLSFRARRAHAVNALSEAGVAIRHDSGGRVLLIHASARAEKAAMERLPGAEILSVEEAVAERLPSMDETEQLFLQALQIRASDSYRRAKQRRRVGDTPEERDLISAPDVRDEY